MSLGEDEFNGTHDLRDGDGARCRGGVEGLGREAEDVGFVHEADETALFGHGEGRKGASPEEAHCLGDGVLGRQRPGRLDDIAQIAKDHVDEA